LKGLAEEDGELGKDNPSREQVEYECGQRTIKMKTINKKVK
jgi:membrane-bound inhibitor of C-type lysozyme